MLTAEQVLAALKKADASSELPAVEVSDAAIVAMYSSPASHAARCSVDDAVIRKLAKIASVSQMDIPSAEVAARTGVPAAQRVFYLLS